MTTPAHQHCAHECKCPDYFNGGDPSNPKVCSEKKCKHDTRKAAAIAEHEENRDESSLAALQKINDALQKLYPNDFALQINAKQLGQLQAEHDERVREEERERVLKIALALIKHEGFLSVEYDNPLVMIPDVERCFDAIRVVDDKESLRRGDP